MTDDSTAERNSLKSIYPLAILLLCIFHVLQAFLRYVTDSEHHVKKPDRCVAVDMMKSLIYAQTEEELQKKYEEMLENDIVKNNKILKKHLSEDIFPRAKEWALCYRQGLMTRGNNVNNYMEVMLLQFKDIVFQRVKAFNTVQLFDFLTTRLDGYLESRISCVLSGRNPNISSKYRPIASDKLETLVASRVSETIFRVQNKKTGGDYVVDMGLSMCSCPVGNTGAQCKHQYFVAKKFKIPTQQFYEFMDMHQKLALHRIMTGNIKVPAGWYADLQDMKDYLPNEVSDDQPIIANNPDIQDDHAMTIPDSPQVNDDAADERQAMAITKCKERLNNIFERFNKALDTKPEECLKAFEEFCTSVEAQKTDSGLFSSLFQMKNVRRAGKSIKVSMEAVRRRKVHLGGRKCQQTGRPPKAAFVPEHGYSHTKGTQGPMNAAPTKRKAKAPHSFSQRVDTLRSEPLPKRARK